MRDRDAPSGLSSESSDRVGLLEDGAVLMVQPDSDTLGYRPRSLRREQKVERQGRSPASPHEHTGRSLAAACAYALHVGLFGQGISAAEIVGLLAYFRGMSTSSRNSFAAVAPCSG